MLDYEIKSFPNKLYHVMLIALKTFNILYVWKHMFIDKLGLINIIKMIRKETLTFEISSDWYTPKTCQIKVIIFNRAYKIGVILLNSQFSLSFVYGTCWSSRIWQGNKQYFINTSRKQYFRCRYLSPDPYNYTKSFFNSTVLPVSTLV